MATLEHSLQRLRSADREPEPELIKAILAHGPAALEPLITLACDHTLMTADEPQCYAPVHALYLLAELRAPEMIRPLLEQLPFAEEFAGDPVLVFWQQNLPQLISSPGAAAIEPLLELLNDSERPFELRGSAALALAHALALAPEQREAVVATLTSQFRSNEQPILRAWLAQALSLLAVKELYSEIMAAYRSGQIDQRFWPASQARQGLLGKQHPGLNCAGHTIWERYQQHPLNMLDEENDMEANEY